MSEYYEELSKWFEKLQKFPPDCHLLCPRTGEDDEENYKTLDDPDSRISVEEKEKRILDGNERIEATYWNSLIFGFDKETAGKWADEFSKRLEDQLKFCSDCVLNWHMKRKAYMQKWAERWNEEALAHIQDLLDSIDVKRIDRNIQWAKAYIEKIETETSVFKKSQFGEHLPEVHITVYEALCCLPYMVDPDRRTSFQFVFRRLQGKSYLKLGTKDPLPGMTFFLFDRKNENRRTWAMENWKNLDSGAMSEEQFDWAVSGGLVDAIDEINTKDLSQPNSETYLEIERFWQSFEEVLRALSGDIILNRLRNLEVRPRSPNIYDLLFRHIQYCHSEGVLVVTIRIITSFLKKSPKAFWDVIGDARPNVISDLLFSSPVYKSLLRQSIENCWTGYDTTSSMVPFPTSWVDPWLKSLGRDRRYDACERLMQTLFETLAKDASIGESGQAACIRAGFDAMYFTMSSFLDSETKIGVGTAHLYASAAFNLPMKHKELILRNLRPPEGTGEGWKTFQVATAASKVMKAAMKLDMKIFAEEFNALLDNKQLQSTITRNSTTFWEGVVEMFDRSNEQAEMAIDIILSLEPLIGIEQIRPLKNGQLNESSKLFNQTLTGTTDILGRILARMSDLDVDKMDTLFNSRAVFQDVIGLSVHGESDLAEAAVELLKGWTGEMSRSDSLEHMSQLHPNQTLASIVMTLERLLKPPYPWGSIRPILNMSRDVLRGLVDPSKGVLRVKTLDKRSAAIVIRWWSEQWRFVSSACRNIENWSRYIQNSVMQDFCRDIMELAEALIAEDSLITSALHNALGKSEKETMSQVLIPTKQHFGGMENMIRLKDRYLVDVTVRVLCKILTRLRENSHEIHAASRKLITDACLPTAVPGKYVRSTNLTDQQRAELLQALGQTDDDVQIYQLGIASQTTNQPQAKTREKAKKQSRLDAWSKSGPSSTSTSSSRTNRDDVLELSKSIDNPLLKQIEARQAKTKLKAKLPDHKAISALKETRQREKAEKAKRDAEVIARAKRLRGEVVPGEGSGIHGLGVLGKDHGRSDIMVNSSEDDDDTGEEDSGQDELATLSAVGQKGLDEHAERRRRALRDKERKQPVKKTRVQRSVKEMRARLVPPMERLHNTILAWDIFHNGIDPPAGPKAFKVATEYADPRTYQETFFPLLASEAWRSFVTSKDEATAKSFGIKIASRASVDSFLEVAFTMAVVQNRERGVFEGDILLVSEAENPLAQQSAKHCLARVHRRTFKKDLVEITFRVASRSNPLSQVLTPGTSIYGVKIANMTTIEREYASLESLQYYDLMDEILKAEPSPILRYGDEKISNCMDIHSLNRGQAMAVLGAHDNDGFTLIQGPPGTGKTKTIVAMVGTLLSEQLGRQASSGVPVGVPSRPHGAPAGSNQAREKKLLVCAPSNAAVDELVLRLKKGIKTSGGKTKEINVIRLGKSDSINANVRDVTLDELVKARLEGDKTKDKAMSDRAKLHEDAGKIKEELAILIPQQDAARGLEDRTLYNTLTRKRDDLKRQQMQIGKQIDASKESGNSAARETEMRRRQIQQEILNSAHVLCATLSGSGHDMFRNLDVEFETVIIDEAAQCVELSALIPLKYGCCKCILVGDPKQLPPTVLSQSAARFGYDQSLFVRMQQNHPQSVHLLDMQYRMHPEISMFPSKEFYEGQLQDGQNMQELRQQPWHKSQLLGPYRFFDVQGVQERGSRGQSLVNTRELEVAMSLYDRFSKEYSDCDLNGKIGIITPYKAQLFELRNRFKARYGEAITNIIEFNTTDAFQGRECEIIIFSCVRASPTGGIGFMNDIRRMNVGLTRAKSSLWILGDSKALVQGEFWRKLIEDAQSRDRYTKGDILGMFRRPLEQAKPNSYLPPTTSAIVGAFPSPQPAQDREVAMTDAPVPRAPSSSTTTLTSLPYSPRATPVVKAGGTPNSSQIPGLGGLERQPEVVPRTGGPPVIHTSQKPPSSETKKRSHESSESNQPGTKRIANEKARGGGGMLMGKFGGQKLKPIKAPTDPSAMTVLGMIPPERPPPPNMTDTMNAMNQTKTSNGSTSYQTSSTSSTKPTTRPPLPLPIPRKKAPPSLFHKKKR
ncbi:hypothetical protein G7046_g7610 [Stylonectria norvegica]|nr:hypothetical protein G7046_g7610 [Stylonectria norvegica]